ncbi:hypothetical protein C816_01798 [Oscillibacter sp. 1-3]|nr:hypothetical protein C816_01798 [Oscillibacter sp. 1-3]
MCRAKKLTLMFVTLVFLIASLCQSASAIELSPRASLYLNGYGAGIYPGTSKGSVRIDFTVTATTYSDYVGVSELIIYKSSGTRVATITGTVANGLLREDDAVHLGHYTYYGEPGGKYYAKLTMYAERDGGSDSREYLTTTCTAPS